MAAPRVTPKAPTRGEEANARSYHFRCGPVLFRLVEQIELGEGGCWLWTGYTTADGYAQMGISGKYKTVHRVAYEHLVGPIPSGMQIDHLCRIRRCVNPDHLEAVSHRVNVLRGDGVTAQNARKTHCPRGHALTADNIIIQHGNGRRCRECQLKAQREAMRNRRAANKGA